MNWKCSFGYIEKDLVYDSSKVATVVQWLVPQIVAL